MATRIPRLYYEPHRYIEHNSKETHRNLCGTYGSMW